EVEKDKKFYEESGGGVTLSGGECTLQFEFVEKLLKALKEQNINTCIETNAIVAQDRLKKLVPLVDTFLVDYKLTDCDLHREYIGCDNTLVLANITLLHSLGANMILRCPIIPGVNDTEYHFQEIAKICKTYPCIKNAELMPYHDIGKHKWEQIGKSYSFTELETVSEDKVQQWKEIIKKYGGRVG
uniref:glycyl-radical enzyme activating protein n=1 Tax=Petroclostridium xylanilyticum TaxID=1792311 RepID=UPI000E3E1D6C